MIAVTDYPTDHVRRKNPGFVSRVIRIPGAELDAEAEEDFLVLWNEENELWVMLKESDYARPSARRAALGNLGAAIFDKRHPGVYGEMVRRRAEGVGGNDWRLWGEYKKLTEF